MQSWQCKITAGKCWENLFKQCCRGPLFVFSSIDCNWSQSVVVSWSLEAEWAHVHSAVPSLTPEHSRHLESDCDSNRKFQRLYPTGYPLASVHWPSVARGPEGQCSLLAFHYSRMHCRATRHIKAGPLKDSNKKRGLCLQHRREETSLTLDVYWVWRGGVLVAPRLCHI